MSYHEKRSVISMICSILITAAYAGYVFQRYLAGGTALLQDYHFWGVSFLIFILVSIVVKIIITIAFNIYYRITAREEEPSFSDERDQLIELKADRNASYTVSIGIVLSMLLLVFNQPPYATFIGIIFFGLLSSVIDDFTQLYLYRRGS